MLVPRSGGCLLVSHNFINLLNSVVAIFDSLNKIPQHRVPRELAIVLVVHDVAVLVDCRPSEKLLSGCPVSG